MRLFTHTSIISLALAAALALPGTALATIITASEQIVDQLAMPDYRDLAVFQDFNGSTFNVFTVDSEIVSTLNIDDDFGYLGTEAVTYNHHLGWMNLDGATILGGSLELLVANESGDVESLMVDFTDYLPIFSGDSASVPLDSYGLNLFYEDHFLTVDFSLANGSDPFQILSSNLSLTYEYSTAPEPSAMILFGTGIAGIFALKRRKFLGKPQSL